LLDLIWGDITIMDNKVKLDQMKVLITSECNLNCTHCFRSFDKHKYYISNEKLLEIVDYAISTSCESISFSGGEFFMHPYAYELLDYCFSKKVKVKILTNATKVDRFDFFEKYRGVDLLSFQISLDGMRENHDLRRGKGMFDLVMRNVKRLKTYGFYITVSMTIDQDNMYDVVDLLNLSCFDKFNFLPVAFAGEKTKQGRPIMDEAYREYENIIRLIYTSKNGDVDLGQRCRMFPHQLGIKYDGCIYPCAVARDYGIYCLGNLTKEPISEVVDNFLNTEKAKELLDYKDNLFAECDECSVKDTCNRGCRARAYKFFGKLKSADPFCCKLYEKDFDDVFINSIFWGEK